MNKLYVIVFIEGKYEYKIVDSFEFAQNNPSAIAVVFSEEDAQKVRDFYNDDMFIHG